MKKYSMMSLIATVVGALVRYLANLFRFFGDWAKESQAQKQEASTMQMSIEIEKAKRKSLGIGQFCFSCAWPYCLSPPSFTSRIGMPCFQA